MIATVLEIVAKKLVDILGNKASKLTERDLSRAASYKVFYALRRIETLFHEVSEVIQRPPEQTPDWCPLSDAEVTAIGVPREELYRRQTIVRLVPKFNELSDELKALKNAFREMDGKLEIYHSLDAAMRIQLFIDIDDSLLDAIFSYGERPPDLKEALDGMLAASKDARQVIAGFIKENYKIEAREDGA